MTKERKIFIAGVTSGLLFAVLTAGMFVARELHSHAADGTPTVSKVQPVEGSAATTNPTDVSTSLQLAPEEITAAGVQTAEVQVQRLKTDIEAFGRVEQPETQLNAQSARVGGRIDRLYIQYTGERIRRGQKLAELYSPEVATADDEYRLAVRNRERLSGSDDQQAIASADALVAASRRKLELWGIQEDQIKLENAVPHVILYATAGGTVIERRVTQGQYVNAGETLLTLADLSEVWIKADVYESQLPEIHSRQPVEITSDALNHRTIRGQVEFIEPSASPQTRTVPVHVHVPNPGMRLVPGMFVRANFISAAPRETLVVPRSAVLDTGTRKLVYIAKENGAFESREIEVGTPSHDLFPVTSGLKAGEKVVIAGNFLIDSQTRLSSGMSGLYGGSKEFGASQQSSTPGESAAAEMAKITLRVVPDPAKAGASNMFHVTLVGANGSAIPDAQVKVTLLMPGMPAMNMPEMRNSFTVPYMGGMYMGEGTVPMEGSWVVLVEATKDGKLVGTYRSRLVAK